jgi:hypothetical protein
VSQETANRSFDELASGLASGSISRGRALKLMGAALLGGTLGSLGLGGVAAADDSGVDCKRNGKRCKKDKQCCSGNCDDNGTCAAACPSGYTQLSNGTCAKTCTLGGDECATDCGCIKEIPSGEFYCATGIGASQDFCMDNSQCTTPGEFCAGEEGVFTICVRAC